MSPNTRVAAVQLCASTDVEANLTTTEQLVVEAAATGAGTVLLPEAFAYIGPDAGKREILEPLGPDANGPILQRCRDLARRLRVHLILGGFHERSTGNPEKSHNTCVHLGPDGDVRALYRKLHLFDVDLADGTRLAESARTERGDVRVCTDLPWGRLGLTICYDIRFPALYQALVDDGAVALTVPSAFTATTGAAHWHTLLRARAIETQCYVIAPAQHGSHGKRQSYGHSLIIDPWGEVLAELPDGDGVITADMDLARLESVRRQLPSLQHRLTIPEASATAPGNSDET